MTSTSTSTTSGTSSSTGPADLSFTVQGTTCSAWHWTASTDDLAGPAGRPVVVMAHGLAGTKDSGLAPYAEALAAAGLDVVAFDYRGFGTSEGSPRQRVRLDEQVEDYRAAMDTARRLPGVDPARLVLWGVSLSGGHVLRLAAGRDDVAAARHALGHHRPSEMLRSTAAGVRSKVAGLRGSGPVTMPVVARPGEPGALTLEGCYEDYLAIAGPSWVNEVDADVAFELGSRDPVKAAKDVTCPVLVQVADFDRSAPPHAAMKAAFKARALVHHYPGDHFDVWPGKAWFEPAAAHQVAFLRRVLVDPAP